MTFRTVDAGGGRLLVAPTALSLLPCTGVYQEVMGSIHNMFGSLNTVVVRAGEAQPAKGEHAWGLAVHLAVFCWCVNTESHHMDSCSHFSS